MLSLRANGGGVWRNTIEQMIWSNCNKLPTAMPLTWFLLSFPVSSETRKPPSLSCWSNSPITRGFWVLLGGGTWNLLCRFYDLLWKRMEWPSCCHFQTPSYNPQWNQSDVFEGDISEPHWRHSPSVTTSRCTKHQPPSKNRNNMGRGA